MLKIQQSQTADTRTCDFKNVSRETLGASSTQHIADVRLALSYFAQLIHRGAAVHDVDKITDLDGFHADFTTGFAAGNEGWWERHRSLNRHHLNMKDGVPADVNLIDVLDYIADCVMAGMARSGSVYALSLPPELLDAAFQNTITLLKSVVVVEPAVPQPVVRAPLCAFEWSIDDGPTLLCGRDAGHAGDHHNSQTGFAASPTIRG